MDNKKNTGVDNSGNCNSGNWNFGDFNSGGWNLGDCNSGNNNSGNWNSGSWNSGNKNSGNWNSGNNNPGYLNSTEPTVRMFNKDTGKSYDEIKKYIPDYFYNITLTKWISEDDMSEQEKKDNPSYRVTGGYLKVYEYKEAWRNAWDEASKEDREKTLKLPNWDNELFKEISGIDVEAELSKPKEVVVTMDEVAKALGVDVKRLKIRK